MLLTDPTDIRSAKLVSGNAQVTILSLGAITQDWQIAGLAAPTRVVLGYRDPTDYLTNPAYLGVIAGRVANRIGYGRFDLGGKAIHLPRNSAPHTLHGGMMGLGRRNWQLEVDGDRAVQLSYVSPDGEDGFPGAVSFEITISLEGHRLSYDMRAWPDRPTPISLAQHSYYTLGQPEIADFTLTLPASRTTQTDDTCLPTGRLEDVAGSPLDFRHGRSIRQADPGRHGIDRNFVLDQEGAVLRLTSSRGLALKMETDQPGVQLYTATHLGVHGTPLAEQRHAPFSAICLEPQNFPDAVNHRHFPDPIHSPDRPYRQRLSVTIAPVGLC